MIKLVFLCCFSIFALAPAAAAKERPWYKYENGNFEAYSDESEKKVMRLLEELENFRAAVIQLNGGRVPDSVGKTKVVIFRSEKDFKDTIDRKNVAGYVSGFWGRPYIVMPSSSASSRSLRTIRHELTHVLQAHSGSNLPPWYVEGYAEFMAGMTFREKSAQFVIDHPGRDKAPGAFVDWDEVISDDFRFHEITSSSEGSNAYLQSWLLVYYLTLGEQMVHNEDLVAYLRLYSLGTDSNEAFKDVFGEPANEMGPRIVKQFSAWFRPVALQFLTGSRDHEFVRTPIKVHSAEDIIAFLKFAQTWDVY